MAIEDELKQMINSWIKERDRYEEQLRELARELKSLSETCNIATGVGLGAVVGGGICMIGAGVATFFTGGLAAPLLVAAGTSAGVGLGVAATAKIIEGLSSSSNLEKAKKIENKIKGIEKTIGELTELLKEKKEEEEENKERKKENKDMGYQDELDLITKTMAAAEAVGQAAKKESPLSQLIWILIDLIKGDLLPIAIQTLIDSANNIQRTTGTVRGQLQLEANNQVPQ